MTNWVSYVGFIVFVALVDVTSGQDTVLSGLPPIPGDEIPTTTNKPPSTHRLFRFGPFLPFVHNAQLPHPTLPPFLIHPFDTYNNINPIPELPPQPETKYNGFYDLDGNFVSYGSDRARGYGVGKQRPKRDISPDSKDEALRQKLLEEEYAYDDSHEHKTHVTTTKQPIETNQTTIKVTERTTVSPTSTSIKEESTATTESTKQSPTVIKPTQLPTRPLFVSGNSRSRSNVVQSESIPPRNKPKTVDSQVNKLSPVAGNQNSKGPYQVNKKPTQISSQHFAKGLILPRQHQKPIQSRPPPSLQSNFINSHKRTRTSPRPASQRPKLPTRKVTNPPRRPTKQRVRQFDPAPLKVAPQRPPFQQQPTPQFIPLQPQPQRAWAAPSVPDNRDPQVIAYLKDLEEYDWTYTGERPNLEGPGLAFQQQNGVTTPETLIPLNSGVRQQALVGTTPVPYLPQQVTPSYTAPPPPVQSPQPAAAYTVPPAYTSPGADLLGWFGGTPHPLLDVRRFFNGAGLFGR